MLSGCPDDLLPRFERQVHRPHDKAVPLPNFVLRHKPLEVPYRIPTSASRWRLAESDIVARPKHQYEGHPVTYSVVPRFGIAIIRFIEDERQWEVWIVIKIAIVIDSQMGRQFSMLRCHAANPPLLCSVLIGGAAQKVNIQRLGLVYIAGEEQTDIVVLKSAGARDAFQRHLNGAVIEQLIPQPAMKLENNIKIVTLSINDSLTQVVPMVF